MPGKAVADRFIGCQTEREVPVKFADDAYARSDHTGEMIIKSG
jgi:hypothetical protein